MSNGRFALYLVGTVILIFLLGLVIYFFLRSYIGDWAAPASLALVAIAGPIAGRLLRKRKGMQ